VLRLLPFWLTTSYSSNSAQLAQEHLTHFVISIKLLQYKTGLQEVF